MVSLALSVNEYAEGVVIDPEGTIDTQYAPGESGPKLNSFAVVVSAMAPEQPPVRRVIVTE